MRSSVLFTIAAVLSFSAPPWSTADTAVVPETMLAAALDKGGGPEVLTIHHLPVPKPNPGEVLIAVRSAGVSVWEAPMRQHMEAVAMPFVMGFEGAGTIAAVGADVRGFHVGETVYGTGRGFYAEYVTAKVEHIAPIPQRISLAEAGILPINGLSALQGIDDALNLKRGQTVIIHGAAGGVGTIAIQLAKLRGARVLATVSTEEGISLASKLGADAVVNGRTGDIPGAAKRFAPQGVDAVLGLAGGDPLERCIDALRRDGKGRVAYLYGVEPIPKPRGGITMILYNFVASPSEFERLNKAVEASRLKVPVAAEYPLDAAAEAHRRLEAGHLLGKIVLLVR